MAKQSRSRRSNTQAKRTETAAKKLLKSSSNPAKGDSATSNPFAPIDRMMQAFMPFAWMNPWMPAQAQELTPKLDIIDRNGSLIVRAEVPGVQKSHLEVQASDVALTIKGEMAEETSEEDDNYRIHETAHGVFERTVRLPGDVDSSRAKATFKDGVLEVEFPKVDRFRPHHVKF